SETRRMQLRGLILLSSEIISQYWPMRTFVHHNPLHGLEDLHFEDAVRRGHQLLGGKGYLSNELFRGYVRSGRIRPHHIDAALKTLVHDKHVALGARQSSPFEAKVLTGPHNPILVVHKRSESQTSQLKPP